MLISFLVMRLEPISVVLARRSRSMAKARSMVLAMATDWGSCLLKNPRM